MPPFDGGADEHEQTVAPTRRELRPYQAKGIDAARAAYRAGKRAICIVCPTGGGKTLIGSHFGLGAIAKGGNVLWLAHREELLKQAQLSLMREGLPHVGIVAPWARRQNAPVQVASVMTCVAQIKKGRMLPPADVVILDECHHFAADEFFKVASLLRNKNGNKPLIIGLTATPERGDGRALGDLFDELIPVSSVRELQDLGVLVPCVTYAPETKTKALSREPHQAYREHGEGERCFVFCVTVAHAEMVAESFRAEGYPAATIHADTPWKLRTARLEAFRLQSVAPLRRVGSVEDAPLVLCNVYTLTEGVDVPEASVCITARGIGHGGMMRQMVGRVLRCAPGKTRAIWWDLRGQSNKPKIGLPEADCEYSLAGKAIVVKEAPDDPPITCKSCGCQFLTWSVDREGRRSCPECHAEAPPIALPQTVEREVFARGSGAQEEDRIAALKRLAITAADKGYRPGWVSVRYAEQYGSMPDYKSRDAAMLEARQVLGIKVPHAMIEAERAKLEAIAIDRGFPMTWVERSIAKKFGPGARAA